MLFRRLPANGGGVVYKLSVMGDSMAIKAFIFDFDGLIMDTETPEYEAWQSVFHDHGFGLPLSEWQKALGTSRLQFDPPTYLEELSGHPIDKKKVEHKQRVICLSKICRLSALPGVENLIKSAHASGIKLAIASSSGSDWVWCNLSRLGLAGYFDTICAGDEVNKVKPDPALFNKALNELGVSANEALAFEDSPNGIRAARNAGIFCIAIPNFITRQLDISHADMTLNSLADVTVEELITIQKMSRER